MVPTVLTGSPTVLLHPGVPQTADAANVFTINFALKGGPAGVLVPLFIGTEPAGQYVHSLGEGGKGITILQLPDFGTLENLLVALQKGAVTHVNFNAERDNPNPIPIAEVIASLRNRPRG